ncbi:MULTISPECIES: hypothetical protein [Catenuloplanes]|uniref:MoaD/ThiS family protein n=1 Tax=Catenuloplanes niger TaxID=587534 RepID=A0AAE3ZZA7_9ACTN|nr:hypothetical protein [Catenuloplanes niger]MDR7327722.1 hypothetical protein [Catenuloplanes niger]
MRVEVRAKGLATVFIEVAEERVTVRELIAHAVREQVARDRAAVHRQFATPAEIAAMAAAGAVRPPATAAADPDTEVERALRAFERRGFVVFCGERAAESLDETVTVRAGEPVVFLRLVPLAGG